MVEDAVVDEHASGDPETGFEPGTFTNCYRESFAEMVRLATLLTGSVEEARDIVQESFVRLHRAWPRVDRPRAYLHRTVVNGCHSYHRRRRLERSRVVPIALVASQPAGDELADALLAIPRRERAALVLRFYADQTESEIAAALGCRPGTVGSLIHRGLARLRRAIEA
jgi:RNA polymerase sigma factor (sigma-70 family)